MSRVTKPIVLDATGKEMVEAIKQQNALLQAMARESIATLTEDVSAIQRIVKNGLAKNIFYIGDQFLIPWKDVAANKDYTVPLDVVHFTDVDLKNGDKVPGMYLQWHFCTPFGVQYDAAEAFYYAETELEAGTYNIIVGTNWGDNCKKGEQYQFTLSKPVPAGGQIVGFYAMPDKKPTDWSVSTYENAKSTTPIETVKPVAGSEGTNLGTLSASGDGKLNSLYRVAYGYNRWSQSAIRQFLNSNKPAGQWWEPQNKWDRPPAELATKAGFLTGYSEEFLNAIKPVRVRTALNTVTDASEGTYEDTYDRVFLPALEQEFITPQLAGIEGEAWDYWKRASESEQPLKQYGTFPQMRTFALENKTSAQTVRLRSAYRGNANNTWCVYASGYVYSNGAVLSSRCAPACVLIG